jgi:ADP-heptose:LPS heptosyltransferase
MFHYNEGVSRSTITEELPLTTMMRVLALIPGGIGDQILFFPTLDDLKRNYPQAQVDVVVEPRAKGAYRVSQVVHEVITFDFKGGNGPADWGNLLGALREREYDAGLSVGQSWIVNLLLWLVGIPKRVGYAGSSGEFLLTDSVPLKTEQYVACMYHDLLQGLDVTTPCPEVVINVPKKDIAWAEAEQKHLELLQESGYVLIDGGSSQLTQQKDTNKTYPVANWQKIIQDFQQRQPDLPIVIIQGPEDQAWVASLLAASPNLKVTAPPDIGKLAAMIAGANLMICPDSAAMHLAVAVKTYLVALFGATEPEKLLPQVDRFIGIKSATGQMADIPPEKVLEKIWGS